MNDNTQWDVGTWHGSVGLCTKRLEKKYSVRIRISGGLGNNKALVYFILVWHFDWELTVKKLSQRQINSNIL